MVIGNVVTKEDIVLDKLFNVVDSIDKIIGGLPTLFIGLDITEEYETDLDFVDRKISDNIYWTFTRKESRKHHVLDLDKFIRECFLNLVNGYKYLFIDPIQLSISSKKRILEKLNNTNEIISYFFEEKYVYILVDKFILGIDFELFNYIGVNNIKIKNKIKTLSTKLLGGNEILIEYKGYLEKLNDEHKYIPLLYSIINDK